jgi:hypothetical protein
MLIQLLIYRLIYSSRTSYKVSAADGDKRCQEANLKSLTKQAAGMLF